jgi:hypothetical protein
MAYFAKVDENNIVTSVLSVPDSQEHRGQEFLANDLKLGGTWIQTSYNNKIKVRFAGIGYEFNEELDAFIAPKPFNSWVLNKGTCKYEAPKPYPVDNKDYNWNETTQEWIEINQ